MIVLDVSKLWVEERRSPGSHLVRDNTQLHYLYRATANSSPVTFVRRSTCVCICSSIQRTFSTITCSIDLPASELGIVPHRRHSLKKDSGQDFALNPRGKDVKLQGVSVLPTRKPRPLYRKTVEYQ
jgi:hypothetical protein